MCAPAAAGAATAGFVERAQPASSFVDSVGVNVHTNYADTSYASTDRVRSALGGLGIRHIRDGLMAGSPRQYSALRGLAQDGIGVDVTMGDPMARWGTLDELLAVARDQLAGSLESLEGPNEYDASGDPEWVSRLTDYQRQLYQKAKSTPTLAQLPVLGPSPTIGRQSMVGDLSQWMDYGNFHYYPAGERPLTSFDQVLASARSVSSTKPLMATETGYQTGLQSTQQVPTSEAAAATYLPRTYLDYFKQGIKRTYLYELVDEWADPSNSEANYGLLRTDFTEKPAATGLRNLMGLLHDDARVVPTGEDVGYTLSGDLTDVDHLLLKKSDGTHVLLLWQNARVWDPATRTDLPAPARQLHVGLASGAWQRATVVRPGASANPSATIANPQDVAIDVPADVVALTLTPAAHGAGPTPPPAPAPVGGVSGATPALRTPAEVSVTGSPGSGSTPRRSKSTKPKPSCVRKRGRRSCLARARARARAQARARLHGRRANHSRQR